MLLLQLRERLAKGQFWAMLIVAVPLGFGLYYFKKYHRQIRIPPIFALPAFLILSFGTFFSELRGVQVYLGTCVEITWKGVTRML